MTHDAAFLYAYGFVRGGFDATRAPTGLDDTRVEVVGDGIAVLASRLPPAQYAPTIIEDRSGDVSWLSPRAMAHDRVLTWAQEHGGVIPLPMFSMWRDESALRDTVRSKRDVLERVFERVAGADEFGLRVYRQDAVMLQSVHEMDPDLAALRRDAEAASPGQRYLLERKIADQGKSAIRSQSQRLARAAFEQLQRIARHAIARPLVPISAPAGVPEAALVLNGAFLVDRKRLDEFRAAVGALVREHQARGLSFDFTGPWPPYNFVGEAAGDGRSGSATRPVSRDPG